MLAFDLIMAFDCFNLKFNQLVLSFPLINFCLVIYFIRKLILPSLFTLEYIHILLLNL